MSENLVGEKSDYANTTLTDHSTIDYSTTLNSTTLNIEYTSFMAHIFPSFKFLIVFKAT